MLPKDALKDYPLCWVARKLTNPHFMARQRKQIDELTAVDEAFPAELRSCALEAVQSRDLEVIRCGLSALAFVGARADAIIIQPLLVHPNSRVAREAKTCLFEIKQRGRQT